MKKQILLIAVLSTLLGAQSALSAIGPVDNNPEKPTFVCESNNGDKLKITHQAGSAAVIDLFIGTQIKAIKTGYTFQGSKHYQQYAYAMFQPNSIEVVKSFFIGRGSGKQFESISVNVKIGDYENYFDCN